MADSENQNGVEVVDATEVSKDSKKEEPVTKKDTESNGLKETAEPDVKATAEDDKNDSEDHDEFDEEIDCLDNKIVICEELYNSGSRNFLLRNYQEAADQLGEACELFEEIYGSDGNELGMPLLLYAKSLIALSLDENKVLDVPDVEEDDDSDDQNEDVEAEKKEAKAEKKEAETGKKDAEPEKKAADTGNLNGSAEKKTENNVSSSSKEENQPGTSTDTAAKSSEATASSSKATTNGSSDVNLNGDEEDAEATNLQIAWETLELAARIFSKQGISGLPNLAEIHTELANIQFENEIFDAARDDYGRAIKIYEQLPIKEHRRALAEIHYKIGLTFLLQTMNKEGSEAFKTACDLLSDEIEEIKKKEELKESDKNMIKDIEETQQDIMAKIAEIEETRQQVLDEVRAALDKYKSPSKQSSANKESESSAESSAPSSSKPNDISHLIKRKKPDTTTAEVEGSPAKRLNAEKTA